MKPAFAAALLIVVALTSGCERSGFDGTFLGYAEGDTLLIAPREGGHVDRLMVEEGAIVGPGDVLFTLDDRHERAALDLAKAQEAAARARVADLSRGGRPEEIRVLEEALAQAKAELQLAAHNFQRSRELVADRVVSTQRVDTDRAAYNAAKARVEQANAELAVSQMPARENAIEEAQRSAEAAAATREAASLRLADRMVTSPVAGRIERIYLCPGEFASPSTPGLSLLPPENMKIRFFIPEAELGRVDTGAKVTLACSGCPDDLTGTVSFIASEAEYTPPVIFSQDERSKLVYMAEARPERPEAFRPGQPVDVTLVR